MDDPTQLSSDIRAPSRRRTECRNALRFESSTNALFHGCSSVPPLRLFPSMVNNVPAKRPDFGIWPGYYRTCLLDHLLHFCPKISPVITRQGVPTLFTWSRKLKFIGAISPCSFINEPWVFPLHPRHLARKAVPRFAQGPKTETETPRISHFWIKWILAQIIKEPTAARTHARSLA